MENIIIHISGASGSGKTTLGNKLKEHFKNKIVVKDLDELLDEHFVDYFGKKTSYNIGDVNEKAYQNYIDDYINKQKKPIIFVGLNDNFVDFYPKRKNLYYNVHSQHNYYIKIDDMIIVKQKCERFFNNITNDTNIMKHLVTTDNNKVIKQISKAFNTECNAKHILKWVSKWEKYYAKQGYKFMSRENIYKSVVKILNN